MIQFYILLSQVIGFITVSYAIPKIIYISNEKKLFDIPNERSAAKQIIPRLGGIGIFAGFFFSLIITLNSFDIQNVRCLLPASMCMFLLGLKDDLIGLSARKKLFFQIVTASYMVYLGGLRITSLQGIFGIEELDMLSSTMVTMLAIVGIVNAYNLIDGIDGLASGIGILISIVFGTLFTLASQYEYAIVAFSLTGALTAFFFFNVFGRSNKIFMGDTGSLTLGIIFSFLTIRYLELPSDSYHLIGDPAIVLAIMIVPIVDTLRVMTIRISQRRSPFSPDMNHVHHHLLRLTNGIHLHASLILIVANLGLIICAVSFIKVLGNNLMFFSILAAGFALAYVPVVINKANTKLSIEEEEEKIRIIHLKAGTPVHEKKVADQ